MSYLAFFWWLAMKLVAAKSEPPRPVEFQRDVRPVLERRCQPCHFEGGTMYATLPFDRPETIEHLGDKLFTRIRKEREQALIRAYLEQQ